ncbi:MAG TPA: hypothetical protein VF062_25020 [Candidatus Limnocylindrales bacterium]
MRTEVDHCKQLPCRVDRISLDAHGLIMPTVDHLSNNGALNVLLDRTLSGLPSGLPPVSSPVGLFMNFVRLTDKALREYDAARAELLLFVSPHPGLRISPYLRAIDHMENCVNATHRAVLNAKALRENKIGRAASLLTDLQERHLANLRHAVEHSDEKLLSKQKFKSSPPFDRVDPYSLRLANTSMVIGKNVLTYKELVAAMTKCHNAVETIRGVATGSPGPDFPNAQLRTIFSGTTSVNPGQMRPSNYLKELSRLVVTHS